MTRTRAGVSQMAAPYIPSQDSALDDWATNFAALITAAPATYGLDAPAALAIQTARDSYHDAYLLGGMTAPPMPHPVNPTTRTPITVAAKNSAKLSGTALWRTYASQIRLNPGVSDADKLALRLNLPNNSPSPVPEPVTWPTLMVLSNGPMSSIIKYQDSGTGVGKAKAPGAIQAQLYVGFGTTPKGSTDDLVFYQALTKVPVQVMWPSDQAGKIVSIAAKWITRTGLEGPFSPIVSTTVVGS